MRLLLLLVFAAVSSYSATVTSGSITVNGASLSSGAFAFSNATVTTFATFSASGGLQFGAGPDCAPCPIGTNITPNYMISGNDFGAGTALFNSTNYTGVSWGSLNAQGPSSFKIAATPVTLTGAGIFKGTFTFIGELCGYSQPSLNAPCEVNLPNLTGVGTYDITAIQQGNSPFLTVTKRVYNFDVPEPATAWTLGPTLGLFAMWASRRRRSGRTLS